MIRSKKSFRVATDFTVVTILTVFMVFTTFNIFANMVEFETSDHDELDDFLSYLSNLPIGSTGTFSFHTISSGIEFIVLMNRPETITISVNNMLSADKMHLYYHEPETRQEDYISASDPQLGGLVESVGDGLNLPYDYYIAEPSDCSEDSACICIFRGVRVEEKNLRPLRSNCREISLDFAGDVITMLSNRHEEHSFSEIYAERRTEFRRNPPFLESNNVPRVSGIKLFSNIRHDSSLFTIRLRKTEDFFVACMDREHCEKQYREEMNSRLHETTFDDSGANVR